MTQLSDDQIRKSIKKYDESLPDSVRNPHHKEDFERLIEHAAKPIQPKPETPPPSDNYNGTQTR